MSAKTPYVTHVSMSAIHLGDLDKETGKRLQAAGVPVNLGWFSYGEIPVEPPSEDGTQSVDEEDKLMALARLGVAFAYDYKQGMDPVGLMLDLCRRGRYVGTFLQISFGENGRELVRMPEGEDGWARRQRQD